MEKSYYRLLDREMREDVEITRYETTPYALGAWREDEQHMAPATGILAFTLERFRPQEGLRIGRISLDIFGVIESGAFEVLTRCVRPGKTISLLEAQMRCNGRTCIVARAWRMLQQDTSAVAGLEDAPLPAENQWDNLADWEDVKKYWPKSRFIRALQLRAGTRRAGSGVVWISNDLEMCAGYETSDFVRLIGMVDTANGMAPRTGLPIDGWAFPNLDLQIHLYRAPQGRRLGLQVTQHFGVDGIGLTHSVLHDECGPFGRASQTLTIRAIK